MRDSATAPGADDPGGGQAASSSSLDCSGQTRSAAATACGDSLPEDGHGHDRLVDALRAIEAEAWAKLRRAQRHQAPARDVARLRREAIAWAQRGAAVTRCRDHKFRLWVCACGEETIRSAEHCGSRLCPRCRARAEAWAARRIGQLIDEARRQSSRLRMLTLTVANLPAGELQRGVDGLLGAWDRFRRRRVWSDLVDGAVAILEVTYDAETGWHPHLHVVWAGPLPLNRDAAVAAWVECAAAEGMRANGGGVDVRQVTRPARYLAKYVSKGLPRDVPDMAWREFVRALWDFRTVRVYGSLRGLRLDGDDPPALACEHCGRDLDPLAGRLITRWEADWRRGIAHGPPPLPPDAFTSARSMRQWVPQSLERDEKGFGTHGWMRADAPLPPSMRGGAAQAAPPHQAEAVVHPEPAGLSALPAQSGDPVGVHVWGTTPACDDPPAAIYRPGRTA